MDYVVNEKEAHMNDNITVAYTPKVRCIHGFRGKHPEHVPSEDDCPSGVELQCEGGTGGTEIWLLNGRLAVNRCIEGSWKPMYGECLLAESVTCPNCSGLGYTHMDGTTITDFMGEYGFDGPVAVTQLEEQT